MASIGHRRGRRALLALATIAVAVALAGCGGTASPAANASTAPSQAAPITPAPTASPSPAASPSAAASAPASAATSPGPDPAAGLKVDAPYTFVALPPAMQQAFESQMASSLGAFGSSITFGFRQVDGGTGQAFLMVLAFPTGTVSAPTFEGMLGGLSGSMGATLQKTTVDGVEVSSGPSTSGGVGIFHIGDHVLIVIAEKPADALPIAKALISANQ